MQFLYTQPSLYLFGYGLSFELLLLILIYSLQNCKSGSSILRIFNFVNLK
jgi:hypothetical protein